MEKMMKACNSSKVANTNASIEANINAYGPVPDYSAFTDFVVNQSKNENNKIYKGVCIDNMQINDVIYDIPVIFLKLHNKIDCYIYDDYESYTLGNTSIMQVSIYALIIVLQHDTDVNINEIIDKPEVLESILQGATIDILQIPLCCGDIIVSPFTNEKVRIHKNTILSIITNVHLNK